MPGRNSRCKNRGTTAASARVEERQNGGTIAASESTEDRSTTANKIAIDSEEKHEEDEIRGEQTDNEDSCNIQSGTHDRAMVRDLSQFAKTASPTFKWGEVDGETFAHSIECCYNEIVHWRRISSKYHQANQANPLFMS